MKHSIEHGMFVRESGTASPDAPTLVWVHGLGESGLGFEGMLRHPALAGHHQVAADIPGYGRSAWTDEPLSLVDQADLLAEWFRGRGFDPVVLLGHSMGGISGLHLCERHPQVVAHFVNIDGNLSIGDCTYSSRAAALSLESFVETGFEVLLGHVYELGATDAAHRTYYASMRHCDPRLFHRNGVELVEISKPEIPAARLAALPQRLTHVPGIPGGNAVRSRELLAEHGIATRAIEPAGHWPFLDRPDEFAALVNELVRTTER